MLWAERNKTCLPTGNDSQGRRAGKGPGCTSDVGARKLGRNPARRMARSLTVVECPPASCRQAKYSDAGDKIRPQGRRTSGPEGAIAVPRRQPERSEACRHAVAREVTHTVPKRFTDSRNGVPKNPQLHSLSTRLQRYPLQTCRCTEHWVSYGHCGVGAAATSASIPKRPANV